MLPTLCTGLPQCRRCLSTQPLLFLGIDRQHCCCAQVEEYHRLCQDAQEHTARVMVRTCPGLQLPVAFVTVSRDAGIYRRDVV